MPRIAFRNKEVDRNRHIEILLSWDKATICPSVRRKVMLWVFGQLGATYAVYSIHYIALLDLLQHYGLNILKTKSILQ